MLARSADRKSSNGILATGPHDEGATPNAVPNTLRHPLAFPPFPGFASDAASLLPPSFIAGRGGILQLLDMSLSPCCPYHPAGVSCRLGQPATCHAAFAPKQGARPPDLYFVSRPPMGLLSLRPGNSLTILTMALSVGFIRFVILRGYDPS